MILVDSGPIVALILELDQHRETVAQAAINVSGPLVTTSACLTEIMYFLGRSDGWRGQNAARQMIRTGFLIIHSESEGAPLRALEYMERFQDIPCDYADASLLAAAEETGIRRIFTIDHHFHAYRLFDGSALDVTPA